MKDIITKFLKKPVEYSREIEKVPLKFYLYIIALSIILRITINLISPHNFPQEFSFKTIGIYSPTLSEYIISSILLVLINLMIFTPLMLVNIIVDSSFLKFIFLNAFFMIILLIPIFMKGYYVLFIMAFTIFLIILIIKNIEKYYVFFKIITSLGLLTIIFTPFVFLSEILESESLFTIFNLLSGIIYLIYLVKTIKAKFDISIIKIIIYLTSSFVISFLYGFLLYKSAIFSTNIIKLLLY